MNTILALLFCFNTILAVGLLIHIIRLRPVRTASPHNCERDGHRYGQWKQESANIAYRNTIIVGRIQTRKCEQCGCEEIEEICV